MAAFLLSFGYILRHSSEPLSDIFISHGALVLHGLSSVFLDHTEGILKNSLGQNLATGASTLGAAFIGLPLYTFRKVAVRIFAITRRHLILTPCL
jgi:solute carrier family 30 (zinc transporter), member 5/7